MGDSSQRGKVLISLDLLGGLAAYTGGAGIIKSVLRVMFWGAMAITAGVGMLFGAPA